MSLVDDVVAEAHAQLGKPYVLGTEGPSTFDCSGLMWWCFDQNGAGALIGGSRRRAAGYTRWAADHGQFTRDFRRAERGDLLVYEHPVGHVGLYLGSSNIISALVPPYGVKQTKYNRISVPFYGVILVDYGAGRTTTEDAPDTTGTEDDTIHARDPDWTSEGIDNPRGRALWHIEFADRPRRADGGGHGVPDVVNKITRRRTPPGTATPETDTTDGSPLSITRKQAKREVVGFDSADAMDVFTYGSVAGGPFPGSYIQYWVTQANPNWPCSGLGTFYWTGWMTEEGWLEVDLSGGVDADWLGIKWSSTAGADPVDHSFGVGHDAASCEGWDYLVGWGLPDPAALGEWTLLGHINPFAPWEVFVPRSLLTAAENALVIIPNWQAGNSFCGTEIVDNTRGPLIGGEGSSRRFQLSSDTSISAVPVTVTGTGHTQWVPADGDIDGSNDTFTLLGWDGSGVPEARVDGLIMAATDYVFDAGALTVTFAEPPPAGAAVAFRYNHS